MNRQYYTDIVKKSQTFLADWAQRGVHGQLKIDDLRVFAREYNSHIDTHRKALKQYKDDIELLRARGREDYESAIFLVGAIETIKLLIDQHIHLAKTLNKAVERQLGLKPGSLMRAPETKFKETEPVDPYGKIFH